MPAIPHTRLFSRKISDFCRLRVDPVLPPQESERIRNFLVGLISRSQIPPRKLQGYDWEEIAYQCDLDKESLRIARATIKPALDAIVRNTASSPMDTPATIYRGSASETGRLRGRPPRKPAEKAPPASRNATSNRTEQVREQRRQTPGTKPRLIEEFPTPLYDEWLDPPTFPKPQPRLLSFQGG